MEKKFDDADLKYLCNVNVLFTYMKNGMEFLINNKSELIYDFFVVYKDVYYYINMWTNYKEEKNDLHISLNNQQYNSMEEFKDNAKLGDILINDIKDNLEIIPICNDILRFYQDSMYLGENEVKDNKPINHKEFKYDKSITKAYLFIGVFFTLFTIASRWIFKGQNGNIIGFVFFDSLSIFAMYLYFYHKRKKIVYRDRTFTVYGVISKKVYLIEDIEGVSEQPPKGITVRIKNGKKIKFDTFINNHRDIRRILKQNGIEIKQIPFKNYLRFNKNK